MFSVRVSLSQIINDPLVVVRINIHLLNWRLRSVSRKPHVLGLHYNIESAREFMEF